MSKPNPDHPAVLEALDILGQIARAENSRRARIERYLQTRRRSFWRHFLGIYRRRQIEWAEANQNLARLELCREGLELGHYERTINLLEERARDLESRTSEARAGDDELHLLPHQGLARWYENMSERLHRISRGLQALNDS